MSFEPTTVDELPGRLFESVTVDELPDRFSESTTVDELPGLHFESITVDELLSLLSEPQTVALCGHINPDGDAIGSLLALGAFLKARGHQVSRLLAGKTQAPELYSFLNDYEFVLAEQYDETPDLFIAVDTPNKERLGDAVPVFERALKTLCIDHHPDYTGFTDLYMGDAEASATGLIIWNLIMASDTPVTSDMAEACYIALITDTGRFSFQNTNAEAFSAAKEMVAAGVDPSKMSSLVFDSQSLGLLKLNARLISRMEFAFGGKLVLSWVTEEDFAELGASREDVEGMPTLLRSVKGCEVAVLLRVEEDRVRVNLRAKGSADVGELARRYGGGGHRAAAGFTLKTSLDEVKALVIQEANNLVSHII